ncbi:MULTISPECIES: aminodeoxychorismate synthase component I [Listeria]|uniref:aminodeoxychorismate synthase component I n=1 Tax=Listeria TaxID=1637 RepID=UPI000B5874EC|nr:MULTISPECIES: aminodeoxychorismate synthase component I [Listeria]
MENQLRFDFEGQTMCFSEPKEILMAFTHAEVAAVFQRAEKWRKDGYYIAGFVSYEAAPAFNEYLRTFCADKNLPLVWFGVFDSPVPNFEAPPRIKPTFAFTADMTFPEYQSRIARIRAEIAAGNTYQTNFTLRLNSPVLAGFEAGSAYRHLREQSEARYTAMLTTNAHQILSASPELFFKVEKGKVTTRPMKGTVRRGDTAELDAVRRDFLANDEKNRAENVMIVDLLRNDLGQIACPGSVRVPRLCELEPYPTVWQMTSTVTAELASEKSLFEIFEALFPCGSITGAPKKNTMDFITELETSARGVYCGAIGYVKPDGDMIWSVPIRTIQIDLRANVARYGVGGGIVWDSDAAAEFAEIEAKSAVLADAFPPVELIESLRLENGELKRLQAHLDRMEKSAQIWALPFERSAARSLWQTAAAEHSNGVFKFRAELKRNGDFVFDVQEISCTTPVWTAKIASKPLPRNSFLAHKTTRREMYEELREPDVTETLLYNEKEELTEFISGNLVLEIGGKLVTPALSCGLLPGIFRQALLEEGEISEQVLTFRDLQLASRVFLTNSVRGFVEIKMKKSKKHQK